MEKISSTKNSRNKSGEKWIVANSEETIVSVPVVVVVVQVSVPLAVVAVQIANMPIAVKLRYRTCIK